MSGMTFGPYISFDGRCEEAFQFYEKCLGAAIAGIYRYEGSPMAGQVPADWGQKVMHATLTLDGTTLMMGADAMPGRYKAPQGISMSVSVNDPDEADSVFQALAEGGTVTVRIQQTFWTVRFGMLVDRFGVGWMVNCEQAAT
jgi:PhnB protein